MKLKYILLLLVLYPGLAWAQSVVTKKNAKSDAMYELSDSLEKNVSDKAIAGSYVKLADELTSKKEYSKAEEHLKKARELYVKINNKKEIANVDRKLAQIKEAQNKLSEAIKSYESASKISEDKSIITLNTNDASRLRNASNPEIQSKYIQSNINILKDESKKSNVTQKEKVIAYQQMAQANMDMNNNTAAIDNLESALKEVKDEPAEALKIERELANVYASDKKLDIAIDINKKLRVEAKRINNPKAEIEQLQTLSSNYFEANEPTKGVSVLQEAYDLAIEKGHTIDAKNSLELLIDHYKKEKNTKKIVEMYSEFMDRLEPLVKSDSSLIDNKAFQLQESRISQLENEKVLKDKLIHKQNIFNYVLLGFIILALIFMIFIAKALYSIKKKNKKIALQSLRREMNPHFIFNSLNSVNQFIAQNNELEANKYLSSYSKLMRNTMENSNKDFVPLSTEIDQLKEYLELEYMRFKDKFSYVITVDKSLDTDALMIPNMLIQPQLENAIWHGLRYKDSDGLLELIIKPNGKGLLIIIDDNGIGLQKSKDLKTKHQREHKSRGMTNTYERINLLNDLYNTNISITIEEKLEGDTGVTVTLHLPIMDKNKYKI